MEAILDQATPIHYLALIFLLAYFVGIMLGHRSYKKILKNVTTIAVVCFGIYALLLMVQRRNTYKSLQEMATIVQYDKSVTNELGQGKAPSSIVLELKRKKQELEAIKNKSSVSEKVIGRSDELDTLLSQLNHQIDQQILRVSNMSHRSKEQYSPSEFEKTSDELKLINPARANDSYINAGIIVDEEATFKKENTILVRIKRTDSDSILYQQSYVPKSKINSFVLPNIFDSDMVELQIGYINKTERQTYHYISCIPYGGE